MRRRLLVALALALALTACSKRRQQRAPGPAAPEPPPLPLLDAMGDAVPHDRVRVLIEILAGGGAITRECSVALGGMTSHDPGEQAAALDQVLSVCAPPCGELGKQALLAAVAGRQVPWLLTSCEQIEPRLGLLDEARLDLARYLALRAALADARQTLGEANRAWARVIGVLPLVTTGLYP